MEINGFNLFGTLTNKAGEVLKFEDFDKDGDGVISTEEFKTLLEENEIDTVELSTVDENHDKEMSEEEFAAWEQKVQMQAAVNELLGQIAKDFSDSQYIPTVMDKLKEFLATYARDYGRGYDINDMAAKFKEELPAKYEEIKNEIINSMPKNILSRVVEELYVEQLKTLDVEVPKETKKEFGKSLETLANVFIEQYAGENLEADLKEFLMHCVQTSDAELVKEDAEKYLESIEKFGEFIDDGEFETVKEETVAFIKEALNKGVILTLGEVKIDSADKIEEALGQFADGEALIEAMKDTIAKLPELNKLQQIEEQVKAELEAAVADEAVAEEDTELNSVSISIAPESEVVPEDTTESGIVCIIPPPPEDVPEIDGEEEISEEPAFGRQGSDYKVDREAFIEDPQYSNDVRFAYYGQNRDIIERLTSDLEALKEGLKEQLTAKLEANGLSFETIEAVFENVFKKSVEEYVNDTVVGGGWSHNLQVTDKSELVEEIVDIFNERMEETMDEMLVSDKDMDLQDIDLSEIESLNGICSVRPNSRTTIFEQSHQLQQIAQTLKPQLKAKAQQMCLANGIDFNSHVFSKVYKEACEEAADLSLQSTGRFSFRCTVSSEDFVNNLLARFKAKYTDYVEEKTGTEIDGNEEVVPEEEENEMLWEDARPKKRLTNHSFVSNRSGLSGLSGSFDSILQGLSSLFDGLLSRTSSWLSIFLNR